MTTTRLQYRKEFDPARVHQSRKSPFREAADQRLSPVYVYQDDVVLGVNIALATRRPLLVRGPSGCGKSSLARNVADVLGWRYYETVVTSRTQARDLCWEIDLLRRLHDAQTPGKVLSEDYTPYVTPRVLWWAFDRHSARWRGGETDREGVKPVQDPCAFSDHPRAVVLIDEIDKADPDVPNNLLVPLGSLQFQVEETEKNIYTVEENAPLVFITTNDERELPTAFLRRCVELRLDWPTRRKLIDIGCAHFEGLSKEEITDISEKLVGPEEPGTSEETVRLSPAEFVDTVRAYSKLDIHLGSPEWELLSRATVWKHGRLRESGL